jgi:hypothetical protein
MAEQITLRSLPSRTDPRPALDTGSPILISSRAVTARRVVGKLRIRRGAPDLLQSL